MCASLGQPRPVGLHRLSKNASVCLQALLKAFSALPNMQWWPGGLGKFSTHAVVFARLRTKGADQGVHREFLSFLPFIHCRSSIVPTISLLILQRVIATFVLSWHNWRPSSTGVNSPHVLCSCAHLRTEDTTYTIERPFCSFGPTRNGLQRQ